MYAHKVFKDFKELEEDLNEVAEELVKSVGKGEWQNESIIFYYSLEDYTEYELTEGWYIDSNFDRDYNGAPNPLHHIDYTSLGNELSNTWDTSCNFLTKNNEVLTTGHGW